MKGRKALPREIKQLRGTLKKSRDTGEITTDKITEISEILDTKKLKVLKTRRSREIFREKANQLIKLNILTDIDLEQLAVYAYSLDILFDCMDEISKGKFREVYDDNGHIIRFIQNPYIKLYREMIEVCNKIGGDFGFNPVSRAKLAPQQQEEDPLADLMKQFS